MNKHPYGSTEYIAEYFSDIIADVDAGDPQATQRIFDGFLLALEDWFKYHDDQARAYSDLRVRVRKTLGM